MDEQNTAAHCTVDRRKSVQPKSVWSLFGPLGRGNEGKERRKERKERGRRGGGEGERMVREKEKRKEKGKESGKEKGN